MLQAMTLILLQQRNKIYMLSIEVHLGQLLNNFLKEIKILKEQHQHKINMDTKSINYKDKISKVY